MKQAQKSQLSKEKIIEACIAEFGTCGYSAASINHICQNGEISKGRLYHHFAGKETLYLETLSYCYEMFARHMQDYSIDKSADFESNLLRLYTLFKSFWVQHPEMLNLFVESRTLPPQNLREPIMDIRTKFFNDAVKAKIQEVVVFHMPDNPVQQKSLISICFTAVDYITASITAPPVPPQTDLEGYIQTQNELFHTLIHIFLYGCLSL